MKIPDRMRLATANPNTVIDTEGIIAEFNDAGILAPLDVLSAKTVGRLLGENDDRALLAAALAVRGTRFGHVCIRLGRQQEAVFVDGVETPAIGTLPWPEIGEWQQAIDTSPIIGDGTGNEPLVQIDDRLYLQRYYAYEDFVANLIEQRIGREPGESDSGVANLIEQQPGGQPGVPDSEIDKHLIAALGVEDPDEPGQQLTAARTALTRRIAVMAGGPGTGKTHTIAAMLLALAQAEGEFPLVALAAPTGKAAARLGEAIAEVAIGSDLSDVARERLKGLAGTTIHRLLGYHPARGRFQHHENNRLPHDLVIVDEMSMVSLPLAARLLSAVRDKAAIVLVGDPHQLESIEAGTVLADIVGPAVPDAKAGPDDPQIAQHVVVLERPYRYGEGAIGDFADAVREGEAEQALRLLSSGAKDLAWVPGDGAEGFDELMERVTGHRTRLVELARDPDHIENALADLSCLAVLAAHRRGPQSVDRWRRLIEAGLDEKYPELRWGGDWYAGQPIMITANDYRLGLFNGDIGVVVQTEDGVRVAFGPGETRLFPRSHIGEHQTVHAMTIHKSQGSQFDEVVVALPSESSRLLTRELLYTAVTRASGKVTLVGEEDVIRHAINRSVQRASGLGERLWKT